MIIRHGLRRGVRGFRQIGDRFGIERRSGVAVEWKSFGNLTHGWRLLMTDY